MPPTLHELHRCVAPEEMARLLVHKGYAIIGMPEIVWNKYQIVQQLQSLVVQSISTADVTTAEILSVQRMPITLGDENSDSDASPLMYYIGVIRKI